MHDFNERLEFSRRYSDAPWWEHVYRNAFGGSFAGMTLVRDGSCGQFAGMDRIINLSCGRTVSVDEKVREKDYDDFALERWSDRERKKPGWVQKDLFCDYLAYAFVPSRRCYLLPFPDLQRAWRTHGRSWCERYPQILARNNGYTTECIGVPIEEVLSAIRTGTLFMWEPTDDELLREVRESCIPPEVM